MSTVNEKARDSSCEETKMSERNQGNGEIHIKANVLEVKEWNRDDQWIGEEAEKKERRKTNHANEKRSLEKTTEESSILEKIVINLVENLCKNGWKILRDCRICLTYVDAKAKASERDETCGGKDTLKQGRKHRLTMESDLQSLFGLHVHSCTRWLRPRNPPPPAFGRIYTRALLVSQDRRHIFVTLGREGWKIF